jgi:DNA topoisomerase-1
LSPVLWKKIKPSLSAGRVQSVAVRLIVEREREIQHFVSEAAYRVTAIFLVKDKDGKFVELKAELQNRFKTKKEAVDFLEKCKGAQFTIENIVTKPAKKSPAPPFTTSTLQQEASRKLGYSVSQTMMIAQRLYESGKITYMRTDSVNLSDLALNTSKAEIISMAGEKYWKFRQYQTKSKGAQEAHEAIRPTYMNQHEVEGSAQERRLYELIWKRTIASQMSDAELEKTTATINISTSNEKFIATGEVLKFDGFLRVYLESTDDENDQENDEKMLPPLNINDVLMLNNITAQERFSQKPPRYAEASLVRKMEELGIGRPSTYAPTISTIQNRDYVEKGDKEGVTRQYNVLTLKDNNISDENKTEITGAEKAKLFPTDIGMVVNDFLYENFPSILNYDFTANVEKEFDLVAEGKEEWTKTIDKFYKQFHPIVEETIKNSERKTGERELGIDPNTGKPVFVKLGRFGPLAQLGVTDGEDKPTFASLKKDQLIETITLEEALDLFKLPRNVGEYEGKTMTVAIGRFGPYIRHDNKFYSLPKEADLMTISEKECIQIIEAKRLMDLNKNIKSFEEEPDLHILNGRFGAYMSYKGKNYKIPKTIVPAEITLEEAMKIIADEGEGKTGKKKTLTKKKRKTT